MKPFLRRPVCALALFLAPAVAWAASDGSPSPVVEKAKVIATQIEHAVERGAKAAASGVERGAKAAAHGVRVGAHAAAKGVEAGAQATAKAAQAVAEEVRPAGR